MADWSDLKGMRCTCNVGCTSLRWADAPDLCDPFCKPCQIMAGEPYRPPDYKKGKTP